MQENSSIELMAPSSSLYPSHASSPWKHITEAQAGATYEPGAPGNSVVSSAEQAPMNPARS